MSRHSYILSYDIDSIPTTPELIEAFSRGELQSKKDALLKHIKCIINDQHTQPLIMPVVQYIAPLEDHTIKKLLFIFWEIVDKKKPDGSMITEMILACNLIRKDLLHSNEYVRAKTLRMVSNMMFRDFLEPLMQAVIDNLSHKFCYVRKNALLCLYSVFVHFGSDMIPDLPDRLEAMLINESDGPTKRNAFILLFNMDNDKGMEYIKAQLKNDDFLYDISEQFQLAIIELIRKKCLVQAEIRELINIMLNFSSSPYHSVRYELSESIVQLTNNPIAIKIALQNYVSLLNKENDNNIKLIILRKLLSFDRNSLRMLEDSVLDIASQIDNQSSEIKNAVLSIIKLLINNRNYAELTTLLITSIRANKEYIEHRRLLLSCLSEIASIIPQSASAIIQFIMNEVISLDITEENKCKSNSLDDSINMGMLIVKKAIINSNYKGVAELANKLPYITSLNAIKNALWLIQEYSLTEQECMLSLQQLKMAIMPLPLYCIKAKKDDKDAKLKTETKVKLKTVIKPDGTYGTEIVNINDTTHSEANNQDECTLRKYIREKEFCLTSLFLRACTKLLIKIKANATNYNQHVSDVLIIAFAIIKSTPMAEMDKSNREIMSMCITYLCNPISELEQAIMYSSKAEAEQQSAQEAIQSKKNIEQSAAKEEYIQGFDEGLNFRQLRQCISGNFNSVDDHVAKGSTTKKQSIESSIVWQQLTGHNGPLYAEAAIQFSHFSIIITILLTNMTDKTVQNAILEMYSKEDIKLCEKPPAVNIPPKKTITQRVVFKSISTEEAYIYGYYTLNAQGVSISTIPLNRIRLEFLEISSDSISENTFKKMWVELIWENKISQLHGGIGAYEFYIQFVKQYNFYTVTNVKEEEKACKIFAVNLYGKSKFSMSII